MIGKLQNVVSAQAIVPTADTAKAIVTDSGDSTDSQAAGGIHNLSDQNVQMQDTQETNVQDEQKDNDKEHKKDKLDATAVSEMTKELNKLMDRINCNLEFQYHKEVNIMSVRMIDKSTKEVLREYPPEEMIKGMIRAKEWIGAFLDKNV
jgi:flagellar protein FlaG